MEQSGEAILLPENTKLDSIWNWKSKLEKNIY